MKSLAFCGCVLGLTGVLLLQPAAQAHSFHYSVQVASQLHSNAQGQLQSISMDWDYDPQVTDVMLEGEDLSPAAQAQTLQALTARLMQDLAALNYFTDLKINDGTVLFQEPTDVQLQIKGIDHAQHLLLHFTLPLQAPLTVMGKPLVLTLADPYGTGSAQYADTSRITLPSNWPACQVQLEATKANEKPVPNAAHITCPAPG